MSGSTAKTTLLEENVETVTTTVMVEETVSMVELTDVSTPSSIPASPSKKAAAKEITQSSLQRELPLFSNPLLANATRANSVPIKPKTGRVKSGSKTVPVLTISAPKVDGEMVVMRRLDTDMVNATSMFNAAYPAISEKMNAKESAFITRTYDGHIDKSGTLSAKELAKEYGIDQFMRPLLEASSAKIAATPDGEEIVDRVISETTSVQKTEQKDDKTRSSEDGSVMEGIQDLTVPDVAGMKRRIEELEEQISRDRKKFRSLVTVAVGLAAVSVIPQVLPYFS
ncbi:hypothetical protein BGZ65_004546 [Modicella reniformis]|uniref:Uncharacterized protein n=1 Tax=Modicella reniformis TaxID=1440133 RepID=A0A9P6MH76_9FUNG|nr:hypothetical protein BGZ65_004546 [Modicella reniformis]